MYKNKRNVGAQRPSAQKGITLIALVITIIVMLVLVAVTITVAVNGGLFEYAGKAVGNTQNAIDAEQQLANGKIKVGNIWYDLIDDYLNNIPSGTQNVEPDEGDGAGDEEETPSDEDEKTYVEITALSVGDYISGYPVEYENVADVTYIYNGTDYNYTNEKFENKWRVLSITDGVVRIVSAGVPLSYYHYDNSATSVANLTTGFLTTEINSSTATQYKFYKCGFKSVTGTTLAGTFANNYTDSVQSLTKGDIDKVVGYSTDSYSNLGKEEYGELLEMPSTSYSGEYTHYWVATTSSYHTLELVNRNGFGGGYGNETQGIYGIRPVVSLKSAVKFSEATTKINETTTWEISL